MNIVTKIPRINKVTFHYNGNVTMFECFMESLIKEFLGFDNLKKDKTTYFAGRIEKTKKSA